MTGGGCLEWGSHCVDLCQWANDADRTAPVEYEPQGDELHARYANGVKLVLRDDGWLPLGSCPVRFEGDTGWVETGDDGDLVASNDALLVGKKAKVSGYPANFHIRNFLDCVRSRGQTRANADAACHVAHRLPRGQHRPVPEPQGQIRPRQERVHRRRAGQPPPLRSAARTVAALMQTPKPDNPEITWKLQNYDAQDSVAVRPTLHFWPRVSLSLSLVLAASPARAAAADSPRLPPPRRSAR